MEDDIDLTAPKGKSEEENTDQSPEHSTPQRAVSSEETDKSTNFYFYSILAVIFLIFISFIAYQQFTKPTGPLTIEDLHALNLQSKLSPEKGYLENGFSFVFFDGLWYTRIERGNNLYDIPLHFSPNQLKNVTINGTLSKAFENGTDVFVVINPLNPDSDYTSLAASEFAQNLATAIKRRPIGACDRNETVMCQDRSIVECGKTNVPIVYFLQESGPSVEFKGNCITLRGTRYDLVKAVDWLLLKWYGVL